MMDSSLSRRLRRYLLAGAILLLLGSIPLIQQSINYSRVTGDLVEELVVMPGEFVTNFIIGGFRGIAVDIMWIEIDELWHHGKWFEIIPFLRAITWLQPHFIEPWALGAWHMAYNLYAYAGDAPDRDKYITQGIRFLKEGLSKNRNGYRMWFELGWIYYHKLKHYDDAIRYFRGAMRFEHPSYIDRMVAHAYRKKGDIESEYRQWQRCVAAFPEDDYHQNITLRHMEAARDKLIEAGLLK